MIEPAMKFVADLSEIKSISDFCFRFEAYLRDLGFSSYVISGIPGPFEELDDVIVLHNLPPAWVERYNNSNYIEYDPVVRFCFNAREPFLWSAAIAKFSDDPRALQVMKEARQYGLHSGFCVPIHGINGYEAGVSISGCNFRITNKLMRTMHMVSLYAFNHVKLLKRDSILRLEDLTNREKEVLTWSALGYTVRQIAKILNISETTVTSHVQNSTRKLSARNKVEAIATALRAGFISV